jgi:hypothetical protein
VVTAGRAQRLVHQLDAAHGVDVTEEAEGRVAVQLGGEPAQRDRVDQFVGEEDPLDAERPVDAHLMGDGRRDAPGSVGELAGEELRGHGGLAVRGEGQPVPLRVRLQQGQVVCDGLGGEREDGGGEAPGEQVAALGGERSHGHALGIRRQALETVVEALVAELCVRRRTVAHRDSLISVVATSATPIAHIADRCLTSEPMSGQWWPPPAPLSRRARAGRGAPE